MRRTGQCRTHAGLRTVRHKQLRAVFQGGNDASTGFLKQSAQQLAAPPRERQGALVVLRKHKLAVGRGPVRSVGRLGVQAFNFKNNTLFVIGLDYAPLSAAGHARPGTLAQSGQRRRSESSCVTALQTSLAPAAWAAAACRSARQHAKMPLA